MSRWWSSQGSRQNWLFFFSLPPPQGICSHVSVWTLSCPAPSRWSRWAGTSRNGGSVQMSLPWRPHRDRGVSRSPETQFLCISNLNHPSHFIPLSTGDLKGTLSFRPSTRSCLLWVTGHQRPPLPSPPPPPPVQHGCELGTWHAGRFRFVAVFSAAPCRTRVRRKCSQRWGLRKTKKV